MNSENAYLLTQKELVEKLKLGKSMVQNLTASGDLPSIKIGSRRLYPVGKIEEWIAKQSEV